MAGNADVAAQQPVEDCACGPHRNSGEQCTVAPYLHIVTAKIGRVNAHWILHVAVPWERRHLDANPDRSADMGRLFDGECSHFETETHLHCDAAAALVYNAYRRG